jgi:hypothetical protein
LALFAFAYRTLKALGQSSGRAFAKAALAS